MAYSARRTEKLRGQSVRPEHGAPVVCDQNQEPALGESAEVASRQAHGNANGSGDATSHSTRVRGHVRKDCEDLAVPALQQILTEQPGRTDAEAQGCGQSARRIGAVTRTDRSVGFGR